MCGKSFANNSSLNSHQKKCNVFLEKSTEGVDYIKCRICGYIGKNITSHVKKHHSLDYIGKVFSKINIDLDIHPSNK